MKKVTSFKRKGHYAEIWRYRPVETATIFEIRIVYERSVIHTFTARTRQQAKTEANDWIDKHLRHGKAYKRDVLNKLHDWLTV